MSKEPTPRPADAVKPPPPPALPRRRWQPLPSLPPYDLAAEMLIHAVDLFAGREEGQNISEYLTDIQDHPVVRAMREASEDGHDLIRRQTGTVRSGR